MSVEEHRDRARSRAAGALVGLAVRAIRNPTALIILAKFGQVSLRRTQKQAMEKIANISKNNAKPHDFEDVRKELQGIKTGYDHVTEMRNSVKGLNDAAKSIEGSLKNPKMEPDARAKLEEALKRAEELRHKMEDALRGK